MFFAFLGGSLVQFRLSVSGDIYMRIFSVLSVLLVMVVVPASAQAGYFLKKSDNDSASAGSYQWGKQKNSQQNKGYGGASSEKPSIFIKPTSKGEAKSYSSKKTLKDKTSEQERKLAKLRSQFKNKLGKDNAREQAKMLQKWNAAGLTPKNQEERMMVARAKRAVNQEFVYERREALSQHLDQKRSADRVVRNKSAQERQALAQEHKAMMEVAKARVGTYKDVERFVYKPPQIPEKLRKDAEKYGNKAYSFDENGKLKQIF